MEKSILMSFAIMNNGKMKLYETKHHMGHSAKLMSF